MVYKKFVKKGGKVFGPYYYESYRDENGKVKKKYLGTVDPDKKRNRRTTSLKALMIPTVVLLALVLSLVVFVQVEGIDVGGEFSELKEFFVQAYGGVTGLVVEDDVDDVADEPVEDVVDEPESEEVEDVVDESEVEATEESEAEVIEEEPLVVGSGEDSESEEVEEVEGEDVDVDLFFDDSNESVEVVEDISNESGVISAVNESIEVIEELSNESADSLLEGDLVDFNESVVENESVAGEVLVEVAVNGTILSPLGDDLGSPNESLLNESIVLDLNESVLNFSVVSTLQYKAVIGRPVKWIKVVNVSEGNLSVELPKNAVNISVLTGEEVEEAVGEVGDFEDLVGEADREELSSKDDSSDPSEWVAITGNVVFDLDGEKGFLTRFWEWMTGFAITGRVIEVDSELEMVDGVEIVEMGDVIVVDVEEVVESENASVVAVEYYTEAPEAVEVELENGKRVVVSADSALNYSDILAYALVDSEIRLDDSRLRLYWYDEGGEILATDYTDEHGLVEEVEGKLLDGSDGVRREVDFEVFDFDGDGFVDYVEWVVPHLSAQVYELIYITKAEHLDSDRVFVEDVYDLVKERDGNYTFVGDGEYLRVWFEVELDSSKDITLYVWGGYENGTRTNADERGQVKVFIEDGEEVIARFDNISEEGWYQILLLNLRGGEDVFDLRVGCEAAAESEGNGTEENGSRMDTDYTDCGVWFDYVVDPKLVNVTEESGSVSNFSHLNISTSAPYDSLVLYMPFDVDSSVVYDWSEEGNDGTVEGNGQWVVGGRYGGGFSFVEGESVGVDSVSSITSESYWSYNGSDWRHIAVSNGTSYVDGVEVCSSDMAYIDKLGGYCIDKWEASMPSANSTDMGNATEVADRNAGGAMMAESKVGVVPWVSVSQVNARVACSNAGKHLCTSEEWLGAANLQGQVFDLPGDLSDVPYGCVVDGGAYCLDHSYANGDACNTGYNVSGVSGCYSAEGVWDMVGNVYERVNETLNVTNPDGVAGWKYLNESGAWQDSTSGLWGRYGQDGVYFPINSSNRAVDRGGYWINQDIAGLFSSGFSWADTDVNYGIGFRCCSY